MTEQELIHAIAEAEQDRLRFKGKISQLQKQIMHQETDLIESIIRKDRLVEQLRQFRNNDPTHVPDLRDLEIAAFRKVLPACLKKIEAKDTADNLKK